MNIVGHSWIAGRWATDESKPFQGENPRTSAVLDPVFYEASVEEVEQAFQAANRAFGTYRLESPDRRAALLKTFAKEIESAKDALIDRAAQETGLPESKLHAEVRRVILQAEIFAEMISTSEWQRPILDLANPSRLPTPKPDVRQQLQAIGPVVVFGASNFPLAISVGGTDTVSALAAGCPVVVKAHPAHPGTSELVAQCLASAIEKVGLSQEIFSMIQGISHEVGAQLVRHEAAAAVAFTGSLLGGRALFDLAHQRAIPIPFYGELGSVNPVFVLPQKLEREYEDLARNYVGSLTMGVGQYCTNPGILVLSTHNEIERFYEALATCLAEVPAQTMLHRGISKSFNQEATRLMQTQGVNLVGRGQAVSDELANQAVAQVHATSAENFLSHAVLREEIFGPISLVVACANEEEFLNVAKTFEGQLTASIQGTEEDFQQASTLVRILENKVGRLIFNGYGTGIEICEAMHHGGPYPASTQSQFTSIGHQSIYRYLRPVAYQNAPEYLLPSPLQREHPSRAPRRVNREWEGL